MIASNREYLRILGNCVATMDPDERPRKVRKLSHEHTDDAILSGDAEDALAQQRKPTGLQANDAGQESDPDSASQTGGVEVGVGHVDDEGGAKTSNDTNSAAVPMSKNQLKKLRKRQEWDAGRDYRKAKRKEKTAEKRARKRAAREEAANDESAQDALQKSSRPRRPTRLPITFILDCGFDDLMSEKERISLASQLTRVYSDNSRAPFQAHLVVTSWGGALKHRFDTVLDKHYENWRDVRFEQADFADVALTAKERMTGRRGGRLAAVFEKYATHEAQHEKPGCLSTNSCSLSEATENGTGPTEQTNATYTATGLPDPGMEPTETLRPLNPIEPLPEPEVIYLTSDSPNTLSELKPHCTYIIGGLVDKNRHKGICYRTACDKGIKTAKLPIGEYMEMQSRFVLATNHVVEIMLRWLECGDWGDAFLKVIPKRKGGKLKPDAEPRDGQVAENETLDSSGAEAE